VNRCTAFREYGARQLSTDSLDAAQPRVGVGRSAVDDEIMVRTIDGQPPRLLTEFRDGPRIVDFAWSRDGSQLAIERANETSDIVMLTGINGGS
jgi:hypothetical protein